MEVKVTAARLHPREEILREECELLLLVGGYHHLAPDGRGLPVHDHPEDEVEVDPLQG